VSANLDLDDVVSGHPVASAELATLRQKLEAAEKDADRWNFHIPKVAEIMGEPVEKIVADIDAAIAAGRKS